MSFDLYTDTLGKTVDALPLTTTIAPGIGDNFFSGTGQIAMQGFAKTARAASRLGAIPAIIGDKVMGSTVLQDSYFSLTDPIFQGAVDFWTPKPNEVGVAAEVVGSLFSQLPLMLAAPSLAVASAQMSGAEDVITAPGVTTGQALGVGLAQGIGLGVGIWAPPALGYNLASKAATGAGVNWLQGVLTRGASSAILGDNPVAKNYEPFGAKDQAIDVLLGLVFGAASQYVPSWKAEAEARTDQVNVPGQRAIAKEMGQTTPADLAAAANLVNARADAARAETIRAWAESATPTQKAGLAVARLSHHMQIDSAPGRATSPGATNDHVVRMREVIDSLVRDGIIPPRADVSRETVREFAARAGEEIGGVSHLTGIVETLQRAYIEQGPQAGRAMLDEMAANAPASSGFEQQVATPGFIDELHGELTARAQEFQEKQQPAFVPDPEREAFATEQTQAMQEAAARIAREEGLPEGPTILLPVQDQLKAHLTETGFRQADGTLRKMTPAEADQYIRDHAALDMVNLRAMSAMTGGKMTPEQLLHKYLADVKMRAPAPAGALEQRMTPAQHIADYRPSVETSQYGGTRYRNKYLDLGNSTAYGKGEKGERRAFRIMDKSGGSAADVGFVILELDSKGKFAALRNIEIRSDIRTKGLGENVVATLVAHNGPGYRMDVVDITHGGHVGTDGDALPFWKKMGTQLKNYSRDPNVQMDGMLSLEDYLGARSGQGLAASDRGAAGGNLPANRGTEGAAGSGMSRGGPTAADRAELARLNSLFQGQPWYHSALSRAIDNVPTKAQPAKGWKDWLKGQIQKGAIKADEVKYTGLEEYLDLQPDKITKEQLQTFMQEGGVRVEDVELGPTGMGYSVVDRTGGGMLGGSWAVVDRDGQVVDSFLTEAAARDAAESFTEGANNTRFSQFQLPGAKEGSYRELALVLPSKGANELDALLARRTEMEQAQIAAKADLPDELVPEWKALNARIRELREAKKADYRVPQGHSMGDKADINRLAHIRFNERAGPNGERVLFIEEIQSDWAQQGKKGGFAEPSKVTIEERNVTPNKYLPEGKQYEVMVNGESFGAFNTRAEAEARAATAPKQKGATPSGPFVGKTEAWVALSMKRMIRYAAENGFDQIAWTTGAQQADRYDLSKQISRIHWETGNGPAGTGFIHAFDLRDNSVISKRVPENELPDIIGKDAAEKLLNAPAKFLPTRNVDQRTLAGLDLKVGGEGMKGFYDKIVPTVAKDVLKKLGGGKVEQIELRNQREDFDPDALENATPEEQALLEAGGVALKQQGITITPEMRTKAMESQALFQKPEMQQDQARGYLSIDSNRQMTMGFLESTDPSTPIHERAHFFLEMLDDLAAEHPLAEQEMQVLFKDWGITREQWNGMDLNGRRSYHENFADSWMVYLATNKAPTPELRSVFRRFRDWLLSVFESAQTLNIKVSAEMREFFDRLHGSQMLDPSTDPAAKAAASGPPPPPQPGVESQRPPGTVDYYPKAELDNIQHELGNAGLEASPKNVLDADAVAIANQIDPGMVERLAMQYDADDAGFMAEIRRMIDDHQNPEAAAGGQEAVGQAQEGVPAARPAAQPGAEASAKAAGSNGVDLLAREADRFVLENPDLTLEFEMPDGSTQKMTAAQYLADVRESAAMAREDIPLLYEAAQCLLGAA